MSSDSIALNSTPPPLKRLDLDRESMKNEGPPKMPKLEVESPEIIQTLKDVESDDEILIEDDEDDDEAVAAAVADAVQGQLRLQCPYCNYTTQSKRNLKVHEMRHWASKPFKCYYCSFTAIREYEVKVHLAKIHPKMPELVVPLQLPNKPEILPLQRKRRQPDIVVPSSEKEPKLSEIEDETSTTTTATTSVTLTTTIETTIEKKSNANKNPEKLIKCQYCPQRGASLPFIHKHWLESHKEKKFTEFNQIKPGTGLPFRYKEVVLEQILARREKHYVCVYCRRKGFSKEIVHIHQNQLHPGLPLKVEIVTSSKHGCTQCHYAACSLKTLKAHFLKEHPNEVFRSKTFSKGPALPPIVNSSPSTSSESVNDENKTIPIIDVEEQSKELEVEPIVEKIGTVICGWCEEVCADDNKFDLHHTLCHSHLAQKRLVNMITSQTSTSVEPVTSKNNKLYQCPSCPFESRYYSSIYEHLRRHTKPYQCGHCGDQFEFPIKVRQHTAKQHCGAPVFLVRLQKENDEMNRLMKQMVVKDLSKELSVPQSPKQKDKVLASVSKASPIPDTESSTSPITTDPKIKTKNTARKSVTKGVLRELSPMIIDDEDEESMPIKKRPTQKARKSCSRPLDYILLSDSDEPPTPPPPLDFDKIKTTVPFMGSELNINVSNLRQLININPKVILKRTKVQT